MRIISALLITSVLLVFSISQALAAKPAPPGGHLNIQEVAVTVGDPDTTLVISGTDFDFGSSLEVTLAAVPAVVVSADGTTITATVLTTSFPAGDYLLTVSTGNGQSQNDEYDLTIGSAAPPALEQVTAAGDIAATATCPAGKSVLFGYKIHLSTGALNGTKPGFGACTPGLPSCSTSVPNLAGDDEVRIWIVCQ